MVSNGIIFEPKFDREYYSEGLKVTINKYSHHRTKKKVFNKGEITFVGFSYLKASFPDGTVMNILPSEVVEGKIDIIITGEGE